MGVYWAAVVTVTNGISCFLSRRTSISYTISLPITNYYSQIYPKILLSLCIKSNGDYIEIFRFLIFAEYNGSHLWQEKREPVNAARDKFESPFEAKQV